MQNCQKVSLRAEWKLQLHSVVRATDFCFARSGMFRRQHFSIFSPPATFALLPNSYSFAGRLIGLVLAQNVFENYRYGKTGGQWEISLKISGQRNILFLCAFCLTPTQKLTNIGSRNTKKHPRKRSPTQKRSRSKTLTLYFSLITGCRRPLPKSLFYLLEPKFANFETCGTFDTP